MKGFNFSTALGGSQNTWTCRSCTLQAQRGLRRIGQIKGYSTKANRIPRPKNKTRVLLAATGGALGVTALAFTDDVKHAYEAIERSGRVASTLAVCINEYAIVSLFVVFDGLTGDLQLPSHFEPK
jgi:aarF domain-containing kinase